MAPDSPRPFGEHLTVDHAIMGQGEDGRWGQRVSLILQDRFSGWLESHPAAIKSQDEVSRAFRSFPGRAKLEKVYTDCSKEFEAAMRGLGHPHDSSCPYRPQSNGIAEQTVRRFKEGTRCALFQSGLSPIWWAEASRCYCFLRNITDRVRNNTPYFWRYDRGAHNFFWRRNSIFAHGAVSGRTARICS